MLIPLEHLRQFYDRILQNALDPKLKGAATVQIFATNETDSLCALKILTVGVNHLLKAILFWFYQEI